MNLSGDNRLPLYARLRDVLATKVAELEWKVDDAIPTESELSKEYDVSVHTVRRAVEQLVKEGLLERKHGSGTYVRRPSFHGSLFRWFNFETASQAGHKTVPESRLLVRKLVEPSLSVAGQFGLSTSQQVIFVERLRLWSGEPLMKEDIFLPVHPFEPILSDDEADIGPLLYPYYERRFSKVVVAVEDEISVQRADDRQAKILEIAAGDPIVRVDRISRGADGIIEIRQAYGRGDKFRYRVKMS